MPWKFNMILFLVSETKAGLVSNVFKNVASNRQMSGRETKHPKLIFALLRGYFFYWDKNWK